ncbi:MAG: hypothetical protein ACKN9T_18125 [Candidatus Methylumidiphilus sp.]
MSNCRHCDEYLAWDVKHCPYCGKRLAMAEETAAPPESLDEAPPSEDNPAESLAPTTAMDATPDQPQSSPTASKPPNNPRPGAGKILLLAVLNILFGAMAGVNIDRLKECDAQIDWLNWQNPISCPPPIVQAPLKPIAEPICPAPKPEIPPAPIPCEKPEPAPPAAPEETTTEPPTPALDAPPSGGENPATPENTPPKPEDDTPEEPGRATPENPTETPPSPPGENPQPTDGQTQETPII